MSQIGFKLCPCVVVLVQSMFRIVPQNNENTTFLKSRGGKIKPDAFYDCAHRMSREYSRLKHPWNAIVEGETVRPILCVQFTKVFSQPVYKDCEWSPYTSLLMRIYSQHLVYIFRRRFYLFHKIHQSFKLRTWMCRSVLGIYLAKEICNSERAFSCRERERVSEWERERAIEHISGFFTSFKSQWGAKKYHVSHYVTLHEMIMACRVTRGFLVLSIELHHIPIIHDLCKEKNPFQDFSAFAHSWWAVTTNAFAYTHFMDPENASIWVYKRYC